MVNKNIQMNKKNGNTWDKLYPITLSNNVFNAGGVSVDEELNNKLNTITNDLIVTVGLNGDFTSINEAITNLTKNKTVYKNKGLKVEILLMSGFVMEEQIIVKNIDLSFIEISSEDPVVMVNKQSLTNMFGEEEKFPLFGASDHGVLPIINTLFDMDARTVYEGMDGVYLEYNSKVFINVGCGVKNSGGFGIRAWGSCVVYARGSIFSGSNERGCMVSQGTIIYAPGVDLSNSKGRNNFRAYRGVIGALENSNLSGCNEVNVRISESSMVDISGSNCSEAGKVNSEGDGNALRVYGSSIVYANGIDGSNCAGISVKVSSGSNVTVDNSSNLSNCGGHGLDVYTSSIVSANGADVSNSGSGIGVNCNTNATVDISDGNLKNNEIGVRALLGGVVYASNSDATGNQVGYQASEGGIITGTNMIAESCGIGLDLFWQGEIQAREVKAKNCIEKGAQVSTGSTLNASMGDFTGAGVNGVHAYRNSDVSIYGAQCRKGEEDSSEDIVCTSGSIIKANAVSGGFNKTTNVVDGNGLIFN